MKLSVVATLYQSAPYIDEFYERVAALGRELFDESFEIVLVNDGSPDDSMELAIAIADSDPRVIVVDLSRNFGHHKAMMTGLMHAKGDLVFLIDSDLEEEPEWLRQFSEQFAEEQCDVVYGVQRSRKGNWFERLSGKWFYQIVNLLTGVDLPANVVTARLMSQRYVAALLQHQEREVFLAGLWHITGFVQRPMLVDKHSGSETTYSLGRKLAILVDSVTSFSNTPLVGIFYVGALISLIALGYFVYLIVNWAFLAKPLSGWTSVMASIWLLGGMVISFIGVVGIYLSKVYSETKRRPYSIVRRVYGQSAD